MKKQIWAISGCGCIALSTVLLSSAVSSYFPDSSLSSAPTACMAHPGRKDSKGCHTCKSNCSQWGLSQGEYHCHGVSSSTGGSGGTTGIDPAVQAQQQAELQAQQEAAAQAQREAELKAQQEAAAKAEQEAAAKKKAEEEAAKAKADQEATEKLSTSAKKAETGGCPAFEEAKKEAAEIEEKAKDKASETKEKAKKEAKKIKSDAEEEAKKLKEQAETEAAEIKAKAEEEAESIKDEAQKKAEETAQKAKDEAKKVKESAEEEAKSVKEEAEKEAEKTKSEASDEAAKTIAVAQEEAKSTKEAAKEEAEKEAEDIRSAASNEAAQITAAAKEEAKAKAQAEKEQAELEAVATEKAKVTDKELGLEEGYAWKMDHVNDERPDISEKSESYQAGYRASFQNADDVLKREAKKAAKEDAQIAGIMYEKAEWNPTIPETMKADTYTEFYIDAAEKAEKEYFKKLKAEAKTVSFDDYITGKEQNNPESTEAVSPKGVAYFEQEYKKGLETAETELAILKTTVIEQAEIDGKNQKPKSNQSYKQLNISGSKYYDEYDNLYKETYQEARSKEDRKSMVNLILAATTIIIFAGTIIACISGYVHGRKSKSST